MNLKIYYCILSIWYKFFSFSRMDNLPNSLCPRRREQLCPHFIFHYKLSKTTLDYLSEIVNLNYTFKTPLKLDHHKWVSSQFHGDIHLKILPTLMKVFLRHISYCRRKTFHEDGHDRINKLSNFKCNFDSPVNKIRDTATELDSKDIWNSYHTRSSSKNIK